MTVSKPSTRLQFNYLSNELIFVISGISYHSVYCEQISEVKFLAIKALKQSLLQNLSNETANVNILLRYSKSNKDDYQ